MFCHDRQAEVAGTLKRGGVGIGPAKAGGVCRGRQIGHSGAASTALKKLEEIGELGEPLVGRFPGRSWVDQITVFGNNAGMGLQFAAVGARALALAEAKGLGHEVPTEWLLEDTTP